MNKHFSCYIISETSLGIECAEAIINQGHQLLGIVSSNYKTQQWASQNAVSNINSIEEFQKIVQLKRADYLFSIVNNRILPISFLNYFNCGAINYHDALLPKYAGLHATSWAILNNESKHGITWHIIDEVVDAGDILKQVVFNIDPNETTLSLNLKCYTNALNAFQELIADLPLGILVAKKQNLKKRNYFSLYKKPNHFGFINWNSTAEEINRLYRALQFGDYNNVFSTFKILIGQHFYVVNHFEITSIKSIYNPGTISKITDKKIQIATATYDVQITNFKTISGRHYGVRKIIDETKIVIGSKLEVLPVELLGQLQEFSKQTVSSERFWRKNLSDIRPAEIISIKHFFLPKQRNLQGKKYIKTYTGTIPNFINFIKENNSVSFSDILITAFLVYLQHFGNSSSFSVGFIGNFLSSIPENIKFIFSPYVPLTFSANCSMDSWSLVKYVQQQILQIEKNKTYLKDVFIRYSDLKFQYIDLPIIIRKGSIDKVTNHNQEHSILLNIDESLNTYTLHVPFSREQSVEYIFNNFTTHINFLFNEIIKFSNEPLNSICIITPEEKKQILIEFNKTDKEYPKEKTIYQLFEEQVENTPDSIAIVYEKQQLSYRELNNRANQLAHYLKQTHDIQTNELVALYLDRSEYVLISILAVLKTGGAYVPIDPSYPNERIEFIIKDTNTRVVVTNEVYEQELKSIIENIVISESKNHLQSVITK